MIRALVFFVIWALLCFVGLQLPGVVKKYENAISDKIGKYESQYIVLISNAQGKGIPVTKFANELRALGFMEEGEYNNLIEDIVNYEHIVDQKNAMRNNVMVSLQIVLFEHEDDLFSHAISDFKITYEIPKDYQWIIVITIGSWFITMVFLASLRLLVSLGKT